MIDEHMALLLSRSLDEELAPEEQRLLDRALAESPELRELAEDLGRITQIEPPPLPHHPDRLPAELMARVERQYRRPSLWALLTRPALVPAMALLIAALIGWFAGRGPAAGPEQGDQSAEQLLAEIARTRGEYHGAVVRLEQQAESHLLEIPPELALDYAHNLRILNNAIASCEALVDRYPDQMALHQSLARAYQAKVDLLQQILET